jgi:hypothetical protein
MTRLALIFLVGCAAAPVRPVTHAQPVRPLCGDTLDCMPASHVERGIQIDTNLTAPRRGADLG